MLLCYAFGSLATNTFLTIIHNHFQAIKTVVCIFKKNGMDGRFSKGFHRAFVHVIIDHLEAKIVVHNLWLVGCFLHLLFKEMQFI